MILVRANTKKGYEVAELGDSINLEYPNSTTRRGRVGKQIAQTIDVYKRQVQALGNDIEKIIHAGRQELEKIDGVGAVIADRFAS